MESAMQNILDKYFGDGEKVLYFNSSDAYAAEFGEPFISWRYFRGERQRIVISLATNDYDEVPIKICSSPEDLEGLLKAIIF